MSDEEKERIVVHPIEETSQLVYWKVHTPRLLAEFLENESVFILEKPISIFARLLAEVGDRAIELDDPLLNALMCRLVIYSLADPHSDDYDQKATHQIIKEAERLKKLTSVEETHSDRKEPGE